MLTWTGNVAVEAFTCLLVFKNIFSFILTFFAYNWIVDNGVKPAFMAVASVQVVICLLSIPMCKSRSGGHCGC
jgi:Na+/melibiose symporter-like transporter